MAIRWSRKGKRFYDDETGYPKSKTQGFRSSTGRETYARAHRKRLSRQHKPVPPETRITRPQRIPKVYEVRPLEEEFREEIAAWDGTLDEEMDFDDYMDELEGEEPYVMEQEDKYSED
jgi:hypothetical protein